MSRPRPTWTPPMRADGVTASRVALRGGRAVLQALQERLPRVADWPQRIAAGAVLDAEGRPVAAEAPAREGQVLWYWREPEAEPPLAEDLVIVHADEHLVVADKPHFMAATPGGRHLRHTALVRARALTGCDTLVPMHRLDLETAGLLLFTVRPDERHAYQSLLRDRAVAKTYEAVGAEAWPDALAALARGPVEVANRLVEPPGKDFMQMQQQAGEPNAHTRATLLQALGPAPADWSGFWGEARTAPALGWLRLEPATGRKHQLRVHAAGLGLPLAGDRIYPRLWPEPPAGAVPDRRWPLQLLARAIAFTDPVTGEPRHFNSRRTLALVAAGPATAPD